MGFKIRDYEHANDALAFLRVFNTWQTSPLTLEQYLQREKQRAAAEQPLEKVLLEVEDLVCGFAQVIPHSFVPPGWASMGIVVHPEGRKNGYGQIMWAELEQRLSKHALKGLETYIRDDEPESRVWAEVRGFSYYAHRFTSVLNLETFDETRFAGHNKQVQDSGIEFISFAKLEQTEENWLKLHEFFADSLLQTPDLQNNPRWTLEQVAHEVRDNPDASPDRIFLAIENDSWVGISILILDRGQTYNLLTAVNPSHRGRGIALALKLETIQKARALGFNKMRTNNLSVNAPMLTINRKLGFENLPGHWILQKKLEHY